MDWEIQQKSFGEHETVRYDSSLICLETLGLCLRVQLESSPLNGHYFRDIDLPVALGTIPHETSTWDMRVAKRQTIPSAACPFEMSSLFIEKKGVASVC